MKSISIVSTQMQLLNCVELLNKLELFNHQNELLILVSSEKRKVQILYLIKKLGYDSIFSKVTVVEQKYKNALCSTLYIKRQIRKIIKTACSYDKVIISNYKTVLVRYAFYCIWKSNPYIKTFVVDDGMSIIEIIRRRNEELKNRKASIEIESRSHYILYPIKRMRSCIASKILFFTNHSSCDIHTPDELLINDYSLIRENGAAKLTIADDISICFVGQPLPQMGTIDIDNHSSLIKCFIDGVNVSGGKVYYIPHPIETIDCSLNKNLQNKLIVQKLDLPIEIYALGFSPKVIVAGFYSAALYNVREMRPDLSVYCIYPFIEEGTKSDDKALLDEVYASLIAAGINCFNYDVLSKELKKRPQYYNE